MTTVPPSWRLLLTPPLPGPDNMAWDEALQARAAAAGHWTLRVYGWSVPTLSLGRHQPARDCYDLAQLASRGVEVVRRPTGGRALLHDREVTYSVTAPVEGAGTHRESYARINRVLQAGLRTLGVDAVIAGAAGGSRALPPSLTPCFDHPSEGELVHAGRKLAGSAQWRRDGALLQHGSILIDGDQSLVASALRTPEPPPPAPATLREALGREPALEEVARALFAAVRALEDPDASPLDVDAGLLSLVAERRERYLDAAWTWRR